MKKMIAVLCVLSCSSLAFAGTTDVIEYPTGYFSDGSTNNAPYYRWNGEDWGWQHNPIAEAITTAELSISAWDVDAPGEVDEIWGKNGGAWEQIGILSGSTNTWSYTTFTLDSKFYDEIATGLEIDFRIDTAYDGWAVTLSKSVLEINGGSAPTPPPAPGPSVPAPGALLLAGLGTGVLSFVRRNKLA